MSQPPVSQPPGRPSFGQIYREQYRQVSSSRTSKAFRFISPVVLLIGALFFRHSALTEIILGGLAVLGLVAVVIWTRVNRRREAR